jgi:nucleotide-binding universal stress UspA family protein
MPLLEKAETIFVLSIEEDESTGQTSLERLVEQLRWHRLPVEGKAISHRGLPAPEEFLKAAADAEADLIVMGAYGHSRMREMVFGGFTQHVLRGTSFPIFMQH